MEERLSKKAWVIICVVLGVVLAVSNYPVNLWVVFLGFSAGFTVGHFGYWFETIFTIWLENI